MVRTLSLATTTIRKDSQQNHLHLGCSDLPQRVATSYGPLIVVGMALGAVEAIIFADIEMTIGMFSIAENRHSSSLYYG